MKKIILAALALLSTTYMSAQQEKGTWSIIPRIGINLSNLTGNNFYTSVDGSAETEQKSKYKAGMKVGADVQYQLTPVVALSAGVYYSMQGNRYSDFSIYDGTDADEPTTRKYTGYSDYKVDRQYVNIPLMAEVYVARNFALKAGVQLGFLVKAERTHSEQEYTVKKSGEYTYLSTVEQKQDEKEYLNKVDISIPIGLSYEYENVILDARYNIGLTNAANKNVSTLLGIGERNKTFEFTVGYRFAL